jgi:hypothetical protein
MPAVVERTASSAIENAIAWERTLVGSAASVACR